MPIWEGALIDLAFILAVTLFAVFYPWVWYDLFQRNEPFTAQYARIAQKRPWFFYGICVVLLLGAFIGAMIAAWWLRVILIITVGFFGWFIPHIWSASQDPSNPPHFPLTPRSLLVKVCIAMAKRNRT
jgi:fatty acid desaturase